MRHFIIEKIKADDNLATLFNAYLDRLSYLEISVMPTGSMNDFRRLFTDAPTGLSKQEKKQAKHLLAFIPESYRLQLLSNSLSELHHKVAGAIEVLTAFFDEYGGDLKRYAIENRLKSIEENGSDDGSDWYRLNEADENEPWKVVFRDDAESLAPYTLSSELADYFTGSDWRGEHIGSSQPADFACYTRLVERATDFDPFKALAAFTGQEIPVYRQNDAGEMVQQSLGELSESQLNDELKNVRVAAWFEQTLDALNHAAALHTFATDAAGYRALLTQLQRVRDCQGLEAPAAPFKN